MSDLRTGSTHGTIDALISLAGPSLERPVAGIPADIPVVQNIHSGSDLTECCAYRKGLTSADTSSLADPSSSAHLCCTPSCVTKTSRYVNDIQSIWTAPLDRGACQICHPAT
jgi:hypothetical protein